MLISSRPQKSHHWWVGEDMDTEEIIAAYRGATDPGLRRSYVEVARRLGEVDGREELEMWALQEESR